MAITVAIAPSAIAVPKTTTKAAGRITTTVVNTILNGVGVPSKAVGIDGDFYIDTKNLNLYGPKVKGVWRVGTSLKQVDSKSVTAVIGEPGSIGERGPQGDKGDKGATGNTGATGSAGLTGAVGVTGANGIDGAIGATGFIGAAGAVGATGSKGDTGLTGAVGAQGSKGDAGTNGTVGAQGIKGDAGSNGAAGAQGVKGDAGTNGSAGAQGIKGDAGTTGTQGVKGDAGTTGTQGIKGDAGTTGTQGVQGETGTAGAPGAAGISVSYFTSVPNISLVTAETGNSNSKVFFTAASDGNYTFDVLVTGGIEPNVEYKLNAEIVVGTTKITSQYVVASDAITFANGLAGRQYGFHIIGAVASASAGTSFGIRISIQIGAGSGTVYFTGRALINKVGSIG